MIFIYKGKKMERKYLNEWKAFLAEVGPGGADQAANATQQAQASQPAADDGKAELIKSLTDSLNSMSRDPKYTALSVAQIIYNNCAQWMNKTQYFSDRPGEPTKTKAAFAPQQ